MRHFASLAIGATAVAFAATACGGGSQQVSTTSGGTSGATVQGRTVGSVGVVLVDAQGHTLYTPAQEVSGHILCTGECAKVWLPLTVAAGTTPTAGSGVTGMLGSVKRPDGSTQVTVGGMPLYRFAFDKSAGQATGNAVSDMFGSDAFTWHVVTPSGTVAAGSPAPAGSSSSGGGYGGYGGG